MLYLCKDISIMRKHLLLFALSFTLYCFAAPQSDLSQIDLNKTQLNNPEALNELGYEYLKKNPVLSLEMAHKALEIAEKINNEKEIINALLLMGIVKKNLSRFDEAAAHYFKALGIARKLKLKDKQSVCYNNIGSLYQTQNNYQKALEYFKKSLDIESQLKNDEQISIRLYNMGVVYEAIDSLDLAYTFYFNSLLIEEKLGNKEGQFYALYGISGIETKKGFFDKSLTSINKALQIAEEINDANGISLCYSELGVLYKTLGQYSNAIAAYDSSIAYATLIHQKNNIRLAYKDLAEIYRLQGQFEKAYNYFKQYAIINDSVNNAEINNRVAELEAAFRIEKWENEVLHLKEKNILTEKAFKTEKRNKFFLLAVLVLGVILTVSNLKRIMPDLRYILIYSFLIFLLLLLISFLLMFMGYYNSENYTYPFLYSFVDVLTVSVLPIFTGLLLLERILLKKNLKMAKTLSQQISGLKNYDEEKPVSFILEGDNKSFEIMSNNLVCIEANDNYSAFYYYKQNLLTKELYRISMKNAESHLKGFENILRCHKSYIVNIGFIKDITGNAQGYKLHIKDIDFEIPVSRKFPKDILQKIKKNFKN